MQSPEGGKSPGTDHDCLRTVHAFVALQRMRIADLERELRLVSSTSARRELFLLKRIGELHALLRKDCHELQLTTVILHRQNGSLGFTIAGDGGGNTSKDKQPTKDPKSSGSESGDLVVAKVIRGGPAHKLLFPDDQILKVNGQDLSGASHEEAVQAFRSAKEPIVVEVLRRAATGAVSNVDSSTMSSSQSSNSNSNDDQPSPPPTTSSVSNSPSLVDASTQTEWTGDTPPALGSLPPNSEEEEVLPVKMENETEPPFEPDDSFDDPGNYDIEYEEVTLHPSNADDKLGLTLCCGSGELGEEEAAIFVSQIDPCGIAAQDGRIRERDQILQVNGVDVMSREQVIELFSQDKTDISLLVARTKPDVEDESFLHETYLLDSHLLLQIPQEEDEDNLLTATGEDGALLRQDKDSGVGRTEDGSTCNGESSDGPSPPPPPPGIHEGNDESSELVGPITDDLRASDAIVHVGLKADHEGESEGSSIERELAILSQEMNNIQIQCDNIVRGRSCTPPQLPFDSPVYCNLPIIPPAVVAAKSRAGGSSPKGSKPCPVDKAEAVEEWVKSTNLVNRSKEGGWDTSATSSSAYNTGDSCRSTPLTLELRLQDKSTQLNADSDAYSIYSCESCRRCLHLPPPPPPLPPPQIPVAHSPSGSPNHVSKKNKTNANTLSGNNNGNSRVAWEVERNRNYVTFVPPNGSRGSPNPSPTSTMYTNEANLEHTIWLQQQLFRQSLLQQQLQYRRGVQGNPSPPPPPARKGTDQSSGSSPSTPMEWKVKRRADGTRYITRRPVRNRLLRERANRLMEERGLTTDDDNASELKWGRYWSKEERKRHLERARDHKRKREMILRMRSGIQENSAITVGGQMGDGGPVNVGGGNNNPILELSHKKMLRKKGRTLFDDFTTVQEVLAHGTRGGSQAGSKAMGLLSVTTV